MDRSDVVVDRPRTARRVEQVVRVASWILVPEVRAVAVPSVDAKHPSDKPGVVAFSTASFRRAALRESKGSSRAQEPRGHTGSERDATAAKQARNSADHADVLNPGGLRDTHPRNPAATPVIWLYSAVAEIAVVPESCCETRKLSPPLSPRRSTAAQKIAISRDFRGERRDSNPRPPGPQPGDGSSAFTP
jgi:hypothetical protein